MELEIKHELKNHLKKVPGVVKNAIANTGVREPMKKIAEKHGLLIDQMASLENEIAFAMMGIEKVENLENNIKTHVGVDLKTAREIVKDVDFLIFSQLRENLKKELAGPESSKDPSEAETEEDILSAIESPVSTGSKIREVRRATRQSPPVVRSFSELEKDPAPKETETIKPKTTNVGVEDLAQERLLKKTVSLEETDEPSDEDELPKKERYPGGNDPYKEPVE